MANNLLVGGVANGVYTKNNASKEATKSDDKTNSSLSRATAENAYNKEMFLQLLTAEMQYQDPLEPTSNSEYVAELASFTQIEAVQSVQDQMKTIEGNSLVGKYVILMDENHNEVAGKVDYVSKDDDGTLQLSVNNRMYDIASLESVIDGAYYNGTVMSEGFHEEIESLPALEDITLADEERIGACRAVINSLDAETMQYFSKADLEKLVEYEKRIASLKEA